ncbi:hypothetical protein AB205_0048530, partial [Aquarana catesbeiana]
MNAQFKDPEFLSAFIDKYREMRNLWEVKHPQYYLKHVRKSTLERLLTYVQTTILEATMETLLKKIGILRNMYKREPNKIQESMRSGASADDVYVPRLWYYNKLRFLDDQTEARASLSTLPSTLPSTVGEGSQEECGESGRQEETGPMDSLEESEYSIILEEAGPSVILGEAGPSVILEEAGPSVILEEAGPSVILGEAGPSVILEEAGPSVILEEAGPSVRQEVAGPSRSLTQSQVPPLRLPKKKGQEGD